MINYVVKDSFELYNIDSTTLIIEKLMKYDYYYVF